MGACYLQFRSSENSAYADVWKPANTDTVLPSMPKSKQGRRFHEEHMAGASPALCVEEKEHNK